MGPLDWLFDLDGNGKVDEFDLALGMCLLEEAEKERRQAELEDDIDLNDDPDDF